jgi:hypothetical protein
MMLGITHLAARTSLSCVPRVSPSSYQSRRGHIHLPWVLPLVGCRSKTPTHYLEVSLESRDEHRRSRRQHLVSTDGREDDS